MKIAIFLQKAASWRKIKEKKPHLKFNFTTGTSSIYLSRPFLKLGPATSIPCMLRRFDSEVDISTPDAVCR